MTTISSDSTADRPAQHLNNIFATEKIHQITLK